MPVRSFMRRLHATSAVLAMVCAASVTFAFEAPTQSLADRVKAADAVVLATVRTVEYRMSARSAAQASLPFTFVTFDIERVIRGRTAQDKLTLRFHGGLFPDGRFLHDPTAPLFDPGERSILLVSRNGELDVPLAGWRFGRLRVIAGHVYDDLGKPVAIVSNERVKFGRTVRFDEIAQHKLGPNRSFNSHAGGGIDDVPGAGGARTEAQTGEAATLDAMLGWIGAIPTDAAAATASVPDADPNKPFTARALSAVVRRQVH